MCDARLPVHLNHHNIYNILICTTAIKSQRSKLSLSSWTVSVYRMICMDHTTHGIYKKNIPAAIASVDQLGENLPSLLLAFTCVHHL